MSRRMNKHRNESKKMDEFPEEFDDTFFHNELFEQNRNIPVLRNLVYRKIRDAITERIDSYGDKIPLVDKFNVDFPIDRFSEFEWAVVREEIMYRGINVSCEFVDEKLHTIHVHIEREISLTKTIEEIERENNEQSDDESEEGCKCNPCECKGECDC